MKKYIKYFIGGIITAALGVVTFSMFGQTTQTFAYVKCTPISTAPGTAGTPTGDPYYKKDGSACNAGHKTESFPGEPIPSGEKEQVNGNEADEEETCRESVGFGLGWIICPAHDLVSELVDKMMEQVGKSFEWNFGDQLLTLWTSFLPIANIAFAIVFLIVIYSTATGVGLNNYSVKKILPRLIIVAIAVNISFYICVAMVDLSNIVGANIGNLLPEIGNKQDIVTGGISGLVSIGVFFVLGFLFMGTALLAILVIFLALAARYVVLFLLVAISPLAIVAALLPQTEKWFKKWLNTYIQLLVVYPIFAFAWYGIRWIQGQSLLTEAGVFGWIVSLVLPIAPLFVILPAMKFGGGLMSKMTGAIQKGVQSSPLGGFAKNLDEGNQLVAKNKLHEISQREDLKKPTRSNIDEEYDQNAVNLAESAGLTDKDGNKFTDADSAKRAINNSNDDSLKRRLDNFEKQRLNKRNSISDQQNEINENFNRENAQKIENRQRMNRMRRTGARILTGEAGSDRVQRAKDLYEAGHKERINDVNRELFERNNFKTDKDGNMIEDENGNYIRQDGTKISKANFSRQRMNNFLDAAGGEEAKMKAEESEKRYQNAVEEQKLSGARRDDGTDGRLFNTQSELNAAARNSDTLAAALKSDTEEQKNEDVVNLNKTREAERDAEIAANQQKEFTDKANERDTTYVEKILEPQRKKVIEMEEKLGKSNEDLEIKNKKLKDANEHFGKTEDDFRNAVKSGDKSDIEKTSHEYDLAKEYKERMENDKAISEEKVTEANTNLENARSEMKVVENSDELKNNAAFRAINSSKNAEAAKTSYEAAVNRASRGLTSEVNAQKISEMKDLSDAQLETDKVQRLAQDEEMQSINRQTRATRERTLNVNRAVNVDYATKIKDDQKLATYAGGGGVTDTSGIFRQSNKDSMIQSAGSAANVVDKDVGEKNANVISYVENNPSEWEEVSDTALANANPSLAAAIVKQQTSIAQHDNATKLFNKLTENREIMEDPGKAAIVYGSLLSDKDFLSANPIEATYLQYVAKQTKQAKDGKVDVLSHKDAIKDPETFAFMQKNLSASKVQNWEYDNLEEYLRSDDPEVRSNVSKIVNKYASTMTTGNKSLGDVVLQYDILEENANKPGEGQKKMRFTANTDTLAKQKVEEMAADLGLPQLAYDTDGNVMYNNDGSFKFKDENTPTQYISKNPAKREKVRKAVGNRPENLELNKPKQLKTKYVEDPSMKNVLDAYLRNVNSPNPQQYEKGGVDFQKAVLRQAGFEEQPNGKFKVPESMSNNKQNSKQNEKQNTSNDNPSYSDLGEYTD